MPIKFVSHPFVALSIALNPFINASEIRFHKSFTNLLIGLQYLTITPASSITAAIIQPHGPDNPKIAVLIDLKPVTSHLKAGRNFLNVSIINDVLSAKNPNVLRNPPTIFSAGPIDTAVIVPNIANFDNTDCMVGDKLSHHALNCFNRSTVRIKNSPNFFPSSAARGSSDCKYARKSDNIGFTVEKNPPACPPASRK